MHEHDKLSTLYIYFLVHTQSINKVTGIASITCARTNSKQSTEYLKQERLQWD